MPWIRIRYYFQFSPSTRARLCTPRDYVFLLSPIRPLGIILQSFSEPYSRRTILRALFEKRPSQRFRQSLFQIFLSPRLRSIIPPSALKTRAGRVFFAPLPQTESTKAGCWKVGRETRNEREKSSKKAQRKFFFFPLTTLTARRRTFRFCDDETKQYRSLFRH